MKDKILEELQMLADIMPHGGQSRIAEKTGLGKQLVSQIFLGTQQMYVSDTTRMLVLKAAKEIIEDEIETVNLKREVVSNISLIS